MKFKVFSQRALIGAGLLMVGITSAQSQIREESQGMVLLRSLPTLDTSYSIATVELDPESDQFGEILSEVEQPYIQHPLHHLYYSQNGLEQGGRLQIRCDGRGPAHRRGGFSAGLSRGIFGKRA